MNKEIMEIYNDLPGWKREENFSPAIRNFIEVDMPSDESERRKLEDLHLEINGQLERLLKTKSVEEKIISQKTIHAVLKKGGLIDQDQLEENNKWIDMQYFGKGRGIVSRSTTELSNN